jgi:hypothetical protein
MEVGSLVVKVGDREYLGTEYKEKAQDKASLLRSDICP